MALETASWITELVTTNPVAGDPVGEGDDHLRMLKTVLQNSFPSSSTAAVIPNMSGNGGSILITDGTDSAWSSVAYIDTLNSRVGIGNAAPTATLDVDGSAIFNESGAAVDFRIEGITEPNLFFVDGSTSRIGIGTSTPTTNFEIYNSWARLKIFSPSFSTVGYDLATAGPATAAIELTKGLSYNLHLWTSNNIALMPTKKCVGINLSLPTSHLQIDGDDTANAWGTDGIILRSSAATITDDSTAASGTAASAVFNSFGVPTLAATNASVTTTDAATVYIADAPTAGTNQTITNPWALWVDTGKSRFDGDIKKDGEGGLELNTNGSLKWTNAGGVVLSNSSVENLTIVTNTGGDIILRTNSVDRFTIANAGGAVFNESGADVDFRIEGDTEPNLFFVDASTDQVGIGNAAPQTKLHISTGASNDIYLGEISNLSDFNVIGLNSTVEGNSFTGIAGGHPSSADLYVQSGLVGKSILFRVNGTIYMNMNSTGLGIGTNNSPTAKLDVDGSAIFNKSGAAVDFQVEGDTDPNLFFVDGSTDRVGIGTNVPGALLDVNGDANVAGTITANNYENNAAITQNETVANNAFVVGPITINSTYVVTINSSAVWVIL